jgi:hypothetical protein
MSDKNNFNNIPADKLNVLLKAAAGKLGTTPDKLEAQLKSGAFDKALAGMPKDEAQKLTAALSDKKTCEKILSSPQAQAIYKKLSQNR